MEEKLQKPMMVCLLALLCCALWGSAFPCVKIGYELLHIQDVGSQILFAGYRFFLAGIFTFVIGSVMERKLLTVKRASVKYVAAQGVLQTAMQYFFFYVGLANTTGAKGSVINASNAFISIIAAAVLIRTEKITWKKAVGCAIGFAGVIVINLSPGAWGDGFHLLGEGMIFMSALCYGISSVTLKMISDRESPVTITAYQLLIGGAILVISGMVSGGSVTGFTWKSSLLLGYMALLSTVAFSIWSLLLKYNSVGKVTIYGFSIPVFGVALSALFLGENILSWQTVIALIMVSVGIIIVNKSAE
ncbi:DMT family transporter [Coprococcus sp. AF21-14LB]|uniref:DMT family transporter n=1 Tax=Coprococcus sp. AF21-14LB TaxID=2292231 RepID=UPI000E469E91|nr:DMT family transporter [Coprococcus sp. AF21-14LB]RGS80962.1 DMT family transporter [Coprococcus sp. AF21-14LB]